MIGSTMMTIEPSSTEGRASVRQARWVLLISIGLTALLYTVPGGEWLAWPLVLFATLMHELGHGLAAIVVGGDFETLKMFSDGSGLAVWSGSGGRLAHAFVASGGLVGPALAAAGCFVAGRSPRSARAVLVALGAGLIVAEVLVVRSLFGAIYVGVVAVVLIVFGLAARPVLAQLALVFVAVQLALSVFSNGSYLFTRTAATAQGIMPSDTAQIAAALILPHWVWGLLCGGFSLLVLVVGLVLLLRAPQQQG